MPGLSLKLAGALFAGSLAGIAGFTTLTSASTPHPSPASDSRAATTPTVVDSSAPCPAGTVEQDGSCLKTVQVAAPDTQGTAAAGAREAPLSAAQPAAQQAAPAAPAAPDAPAAPVAPVAEPAQAPQQQATSHDREHAEDTSSSDHHDGEHNGDHSEHESDD